MRSEQEVREAVVDWEQEAAACLENMEYEGYRQAKTTIRILGWVLADLRIN